jgi:hypothetical protein
MAVTRSNDRIEAPPEREMSEPMSEPDSDSVHIAVKDAAPSQKTGTQPGAQKSERISSSPTGEVRSATHESPPPANAAPAPAGPAGAPVPDPSGLLHELARAVSCRRCGTANEAGRGRCRKCKSFLFANSEARKDGLFTPRRPRDVQQSADQTLDALIADRGGIESMTALERSAASKLRDVLILLELNKRAVCHEGVETLRGRRSHERYLSCVDRFIRLCDRLGLQPPPQQVHHALTITKIQRVIVNVGDVDADGEPRRVN